MFLSKTSEQLFDLIKLDVPIYLENIVYLLHFALIKKLGCSCRAVCSLMAQLGFGLKVKFKTLSAGVQSARAACQTDSFRGLGNASNLSAAMDQNYGGDWEGF
ncbi:hypothetical protein GOODEAATRI_023577 [Goodea atripinnis]|uniref:Uncharacterized protein n=1 Tax=Goodea atripinnis TaxID=208336 RepID=A0ABV0MK69_9TELE